MRAFVNPVADALDLDLVHDCISQRKIRHLFPIQVSIERVPQATACSQAALEIVIKRQPAPHDSLEVEEAAAIEVIASAVAWFVELSNVKRSQWQDIQSFVEGVPMVTPRQIRAARALLGWSQQKLPMRPLFP